jgi:hypothetical protein
MKSPVMPLGAPPSLRVPTRLLPASGFGWRAWAILGLYAQVMMVWPSLGRPPRALSQDEEFL